MSRSRSPVSNLPRNAVSFTSFAYTGWRGVRLTDLFQGCGNAISPPGAPISQTACDQACVGNDTEVCGGPNALELYLFKPE
jgi:hypothetical protein